MTTLEMYAEMDEESREIYRFDIADGLNVLSLDYGLYAVNSRLHEAPLNYRAAMGQDTLERLEPEAREVYEEYAPRALEADPYSVPDWADELLEIMKEGQA